MRVEEIMSSQLETCRPEDSLEQAAQKMWEHDIGSLPVLAPDGRALSMITDRDIAMSAYIHGMALKEMKVSDAMSRRLVTVRPSDDLHLVEERMRAEQVRRIPVVDGKGALKGIVTVNDLSHHLRSSRAVNGVTPEEVAGTIAAISTPRPSVPAPRPSA
jgi:CBS domain-containing protein